MKIHTYLQDNLFLSFNWRFSWGILCEGVPDLPTFVLKRGFVNVWCSLFSEIGWLASNLNFKHIHELYIVLSKILCRLLTTKDQMTTCIQIMDSMDIITLKLVSTIRGSSCSTWLLALINSVTQNLHKNHNLSYTLSISNTKTSLNVNGNEKDMFFKTMKFRKKILYQLFHPVNSYWFKAHKHFIYMQKFTLTWYFLLYLLY